MKNKPKNTKESESQLFRLWKQRHGEKSKMKMKFGKGSTDSSRQPSSKTLT